MKTGGLEMLYYRYRPGNELSIKELIYDELFFASVSECNDPYEGKLFAVFDNNIDCWSNLIKIALKPFNFQTAEDLVKRITDFFVVRSPIYVGEVLNISNSEFSIIAKNEMENALLPFVFSEIKEYIKMYVPAEQYFVSFSKSATNYLMWSHYANNHKGYCLIFRPINGEIKQNHKWKRTEIEHLTPKSFSQRMSFHIGDAFEIKDIKYLSSSEPVNAFMCFPAAVCGENYSEEETQRFHNAFHTVYHRKRDVWEYEEEARLVLSGNIPWLSGERFSLTPHQRLFHYESTQLVGIVLGAKMSKSDKQRIKEIIKEKVERWYTGRPKETIISDFVLFEEKLSENNRDIEIEAHEIYTGFEVLEKNETSFSKILTEWEQGYAIKFSGNISEKIQL